MKSCRAMCNLDTELINSLFITDMKVYENSFQTVEFLFRGYCIIFS